MERVVRRRLEMFVHAREFSRAHPATDGSYTVVLTQLDQGIIRMQSLAKQQQEGVAASRASTARRHALRRRLHHELLRHLVTVAGLAATEDPAVVKEFAILQGHATNEVFRTFARRMLEHGQARKELLVKHGLSETLLDDLTAALDQYDAEIDAGSEGRRKHIGARAELRALSDELMLVVGMLDGLNRYRFAGNAELQAGWASARKVLRGPRPAAVEPVEGTAVQGGPTPTAGGDVRPAA
jgi:hypothetical protein